MIARSPEERMNAGWTMYSRSSTSEPSATFGSGSIFQKEKPHLAAFIAVEMGGLEPPDPLHALFSGSFRANCRKIVVRYRSLGRLA